MKEAQGILKKKEGKRTCFFRLSRFTVKPSSRIQTKTKPKQQRRSHAQQISLGHKFCKKDTRTINWYVKSIFTMSYMKINRDSA